MLIHEIQQNLNVFWLIGSLSTNSHILKTVIFTKSITIDAHEYHSNQSIHLHHINIIQPVTSPFYQKCTSRIFKLLTIMSQNFNYPDISSFNQTDTSDSTILKLFKFRIHSGHYDSHCSNLLSINGHGKILSKQ